jgi:acylphosphatase
MEKQVRIVVHGRVHGVGFRAYTEATAARLHLTGTVRNRDDGTVEIHARGDEEAVDRLIAWARTGPSMARVDRVEIEREEAASEWTDFRVTY